MASVSGCGLFQSPQSGTYCTQIASVVQEVALIACQAISATESSKTLSNSGNVILQTAVIESDTVKFTAENYREGYVRITWTSSQGKEGVLSMALGNPSTN
jgi:hypothetical protein